jgi:hypothetical protein
MADVLHAYIAHNLEAKKMRFDENDVVGVWYGTHGTPAKPYPYQWFPSTLEAYYGASKCIKTVVSDAPPSPFKIDVEGAWWVQVTPSSLNKYIKKEEGGEKND